MTSDEQETLRTMTFIQLWQSVWGKIRTQKMSGGRVQYCHKLYQQLTDGSLGTLYRTSWRNIQVYTRTRVGFLKVVGTSEESDEMCELREFNEETGVHCMAIQRFFMNFEEVFVGSNGVSYKHKYFLARLDRWLVTQEMPLMKPKLKKFPVPSGWPFTK
jgi:hypothetical protein